MKYVCTICLTTENDAAKPDPIDYCTNGHDSWLNKEDSYETWEKISKQTGLSMGELIAIGEGKDITGIKFNPTQI